MSDSTTQWERLNAYADGELSGPDHAVLEAEIAADPGLAQELDRIRAVKRSLASLRPAAPAAPSRPTPAPRRASVWGAALAACLIVAVMLSGLFGKADTWSEVALDRHRSLSAATFVVQETRDYPVISSSLRDTVQAPDLTASRLYLVDVATAPSALGEMISLHYRGLSGCRLSVLAIAAREGGTPTETVPDGVLFREFVAGGYRAAVVADGMDAARFAAIADAVAATLLQNGGETEDYRTAMTEAYRGAQPCA